MVLQAGVMAQSLFRVFDEDHSGKLTFYEFMQVGTPTHSIKVPAVCLLASKYVSSKLDPIFWDTLWV